MSHPDVPEGQGPASDIRFGPGDPAALAVVAVMAEIARRIELNQPAAMDGDVEGLHRLRAALRRLRGAVRTFEPLLDPDWAASMADDCRWAGRWLGQVRDLDVLEARLREATPADQAEALRPILESLRARRRPARQALRKGLASDRFRTIRDRCQAAVDQPPTTPIADRPAAEILPDRLESAWKPLRKLGRRLDRDDPDAAFHQVRIRAKRTRYTAEMIAPGLPGQTARTARKLARRATEIQDCLGALQDSVVAAEFLTHARDRFADDRPVRRLIKRLLRGEEQRAHQARFDFRRLWKKLNRMRNRLD